MGGWRDDVKGGESLLRDEIVDCWTVFFFFLCGWVFQKCWTVCFLILNMFFFCKLDKYYWMFFMNDDMK